MDKQQTLDERLKEFFANKANENVNKVYVTSDENIFKAQHYADDWSKTQTDKNVKEYTRNQVEGKAEPAPAATKTDSNTDAGNSEMQGDGGASSDKRAELVRRYIELFDTKPAADVSDEDLAKIIEAKEAELSGKGLEKLKAVKDIISEPAAPTAEQKAAVKAEYIQLLGKQPTAKSYEQQVAAIAAAKSGK